MANESEGRLEQGEPDVSLPVGGAQGTRQSKGSWLTRVGGIDWKENATLIGTMISGLALVVVGIQLWYQRLSTDRVWSAEQVAIIYEEECALREASGPEKSVHLSEHEFTEQQPESDQSDEQKEDCRPAANKRSREDAVRAYVAIEGDEARLPLANLAEMTLRDISFSGVDLSEASLQGATLTDCDLTGASLGGAQMQGAILTDADLRKADLEGADLQGADLDDADLRGAILAKATLGVCEKKKLDWATGHRYSGPLLSAASMKGAKLKGADLTGAYVCGVDLRETTGLTQKNLESAVGDRFTRVPVHLSIPEAWIHKAPKQPVQRRKQLPQ